jgi:CheY-like chemotaxis protein
MQDPRGKGSRRSRDQAFATPARGSPDAAAERLGRRTACLDHLGSASADLCQFHIPASCNAELAHRCDALETNGAPVDDNAHFLGAARDLLKREGIEVVGVASSSAEAVQLVEQLRPDVTLVDIDLGEESGFDVVRRLVTATGVNAGRMVLISTYAEKDFADLIVASPGVGFLSKSDLSASAIHDLLESSRNGAANAG